MDSIYYSWLHDGNAGHSVHLFAQGPANQQMVLESTQLYCGSEISSSTTRRFTFVVFIETPVQLGELPWTLDRNIHITPRNFPISLMMLGSREGVLLWRKPQLRAQKRQGSARTALGKSLDSTSFKMKDSWTFDGTFVTIASDKKKELSFSLISSATVSTVSWGIDGLRFGSDFVWISLNVTLFYFRPIDGFQGICFELIYHLPPFHWQSSNRIIHPYIFCRAGS